MIPYVTPTDLLGDPTAPASVTTPQDQATLGINFNTIATSRLLEMCVAATAMVDNLAGQTLRATSFYEELSAPGHRVGFINSDLARFVTSRKPILSIVSGQFAYGSPPWQWTPIPVENIVAEEPPFADFSSAAWESAVSGQAAILIGQGIVGWGAGRMGTRVGLRYLTGWPVTGLVATASPIGTFIASSDVVTVSDVTGIVVGAPVSAAQLPAGTFVASISGTSITLTTYATTSGTGTLTVGYAPSVTTLNVDDMTSWGLGVRGALYDGNNTEYATSLSVSGTTMTPTPVGPGTITLTSPTLYAHLPGISLSAMPGSLRWATMLAVKIQALERGSMAITAQSTPGRSTGAGGSAIDRTYKAINTLLMPYRRVW